MNLKLHKNLVAAVRSGSAGHNLAFCAGRSALIGRTQPRSSKAAVATGALPSTPESQPGNPFATDVHFLTMGNFEFLDYILTQLGLPVCGSVLLQQMRDDDDVPFLGLPEPQFDSFPIFIDSCGSMEREAKAWLKK